MTEQTNNFAGIIIHSYMDRALDELTRIRENMQEAFESKDLDHTVFADGMISGTMPFIMLLRNIVNEVVDQNIAVCECHKKKDFDELLTKLDAFIDNIREAYKHRIE